MAEAKSRRETSARPRTRVKGDLPSDNGDDRPVEEQTATAAQTNPAANGHAPEPEPAAITASPDAPASALGTAGFAVTTVPATGAPPAAPAPEPVRTEPACVAAAPPPPPARFNPPRQRSTEEEYQIFDEEVNNRY